MTIGFHYFLWMTAIPYFLFRALTYQWSFMTPTPEEYAKLFRKIRIANVLDFLYSTTHFVVLLICFLLYWHFDVLKEGSAADRHKYAFVLHDVPDVQP